MAKQAPTVGDIRTAHRNAVGGMRKRCRKGKNCSAACIQAGMECLVTMPESAGVATTKVRDMLEKRQFPNRLMNPSRAQESIAPAAPQSKTEAQKMGAEAKQARKKEAEEKARKKFTAGMEEKWTGKKSTGPEPPSLQPLRSAGAAAGQEWTQKYAGRGPAVKNAQQELENTIKKLPPQEQAKWNEVANKQLAIRLNSSRDKTPLPPEEVDARLAKQMMAIKRLIDGGMPSVIYDRVGNPIPVSKMSPVITATGHAKWVNPENNRVFSYQKIPGGKEKGWVQAKPAGEDTARRISDMETIVKRDGKKWALNNRETFESQRVQRGDPNDNRVYTTDKVTGERRKKTVDEVVAEIANRKGDIPSRILRNGVDQSGNEGKELNPYYDKNPADLRARYREAIQAWIDQAGLSLATGRPIALPGREAGPGEERSSVDHFTPISTYRNKGLSGEELRRVVDNGRNFNIVEESFNSQRGNTPWLDWATKVLDL